MNWQTTIKELSQSERKLLNILAWLAPEPIPLSLLEEKMVDGADARDALAGLTAWSLARWMADRNAFTVHRLVQEITRQRLPDNEKNDALNAAFDLGCPHLIGTRKVGSSGNSLPRTAALCLII